MKYSLRHFVVQSVVYFAIFLLLFSQVSVAQFDSLTVVNTSWEVTKVAPGIKLKHYWYNHTLFGANENINILEIKLNRKNRIDVEADPKILRPASDFGVQYAALAALNGTFFDMKNGGSEDYIRLDGTALNENNLSKDNHRKLHQQAAILMNGNKVEIVPWDGTQNWEDRLKAEDIMVTGPLLIKDDLRTKLDSSSFYRARHPRSAVALKGKKLLLITVDGRNDKAAGMSLYELADFLKWIKAGEGINLDGGGSTTLWINGFADGGVVNHPSDNKKMINTASYKPGTDLDNLAADVKKWDHSGERPVANVILVNKKR